MRPAWAFLGSPCGDPLGVGLINLTSRGNVKHFSRERRSIAIALTVELSAAAQPQPAASHSGTKCGFEVSVEGMGHNSPISCSE